MAPDLLAFYRHLAGDGFPLVALVGQGMSVRVRQLGQADGLHDHRQARGQEVRPAVEDAKALQAGQGLPASRKR